MTVVTADRTIFVGLDLGQRGSHTAMVALDRFDEIPDYTDILRGMGMRRRYVVRAAERVKLGTPYPVVVRRVITNIQYPTGETLSRNWTYNVPYGNTGSTSLQNPIVQSETTYFSSGATALSKSVK